MEVGPTLRMLLSEFKGRIKLVVKFMPYKYRDYARIAAEAACFAHKEGKFAEMHELLLEKSPALDMDSLVKYGERLGLDVVRMRKAIENFECSHLIENDLKTAKDLGIYGTPSFLIGRKRVTGAVEYDYLKTIIRQELERE